MRKKLCWPQQQPSHHRFWLLRLEPLSRSRKGNRITNGWVACCLQPVPNIQLWILITIYDLRVAPSLPTSGFFWANMWNKLKFCDAIVTRIACFWAGPRYIHGADMVTVDTYFRRMIRCVVGTPSAIRWRDHEGSVARNSAHLELARARNDWGIPHTNMAWKLLLATSWVGPTNDGFAEWCTGNCVEDDLLDIQQCIGPANSSIFPESSSGMIGKMWLQMRSSGW